MAKLPATRFIKTGDDLAPNFLINISGKDVSKASSLWDAVRPYVASLSYEEDEEMASMLEISLINQSKDELAAKTDFRYILDSKAFQEGNYIDLWLGYSALKYKGRVEIVKWMPTFPAQGPLSFIIKGHDGRHKMMRGNQLGVKVGAARKRKTYYRGLTDDRIVKKVAAKYGYSIDADVPKIKRTKVKGKFISRVQPAEMSDWDFLRKLAAINRFDLWVEFDQIKNQHVVHFKEKHDAGSPVYKFEYHQGMGSLLEAQLDFSIQDQPTDVEVLYFDRKRRVIEKTVIRDSTPAEIVKLTSSGVGNLEVKKEISRGASVRFTAFGQQIETFTDRPFASKNEAASFVQAWLKEREDDFLILRAQVVGVETLAPRQIHQVVGLSKRLDGLYRLTQVKHTMSPGSIYRCDILGHKVLSQTLTRRPPVTKSFFTQVRTAITTGK